jgi:hypothetical protein
VLLDDGRIVADGTHAELLATTPLYVEVLAQVEEEERGWRDAEGAERGELRLRRLRRLRRRGGIVRRRVRRRRVARAAAPGRRPAVRRDPVRAQAGVDKLLAEEPDHGEPAARFSYREDRRQRQAA